MENNLKLKNLIIKNYKNLSEEITIEFTDKILNLIGVNKSGKSTIMHAIDLLINGKKANTLPKKYRWEIIGDDGKKATLKGTLVGNVNSKPVELNLTRSITENDVQTLRIESADGSAVTEEYIKSIFCQESFNPNHFLEMESREQALALGIDTTKFDDEIKKLKLERREISRDLEKSKILMDNSVQKEKIDKIDLEQIYKIKEFVPLIDSIKKDISEYQVELVKYKDVVETQKMEVEDYYKKKDELKTFAQKKEKAEAELKEILEKDVKVLNEIAELKKQIEEKERQRREFNTLKLNKEKEVKELENEAKTMKTEQQLEEEFKTITENNAQVVLWAEKIKLEENIKGCELKLKAKLDERAALPKPENLDYDKIDEFITNAKITNEQADAYLQYLKNQTDYNETKTKFDEKETAINAQETAKMEYIKAQKLPFDNLAIDEDGGLLVDGRHFNKTNFSYAEGIVKCSKLAIERMKNQNGIFGMMLIENSNVLDEDSLNYIINICNESDIYLILEVVGKQKQGSNCVLIKSGKIVESYDGNVESETSL